MASLGIGPGGGRRSPGPSTGPWNGRSPPRRDAVRQRPIGVGSPPQAAGSSSVSSTLRPMNPTASHPSAAGSFHGFSTSGAGGGIFSLDTSATGYAAQQHQQQHHGMFSNVDVQPPLQQRSATTPARSAQNPSQRSTAGTPTIDQLVSASRSSPFKQLAASPPVPRTAATAAPAAGAAAPTTPNSSSAGMFSFLSNPPPADAARHPSAELVAGLQQQLAHQIVENEKQAATLEQALTLLMQERAQRAALAEEVVQHQARATIAPALWTPDSMLASLATTRMFIAELEASARRQMQRSAVVELEGAQRRTLERRWSQAWADLATWSRAYIGSIAAEQHVNAAADARIRATPAAIEAAVHGLPPAMMTNTGADEAMFAAFLLEELLAAQETHETTRRYWLIERERREWLTNIAGPHKDAVTRATTAVLVNAMRSQEVLVANLRAEIADRQAGFSPTGRSATAVAEEASGFERSPFHNNPSSPHNDKPPLAPRPPLSAPPIAEATDDGDHPVAAHGIAALAGDTLRSHSPRHGDADDADGLEGLGARGGHAAEDAALEEDNDDDVLDENQLIAKLERSGQRRDLSDEPDQREAFGDDAALRESPEPRPRTPPAEVRRQEASTSADQASASQSPPAATASGGSSSSLALPRRMTRRELLALTAELIDQNSVLADALADIQTNPATASATTDAATQRTPISRQFQSPRDAARSPTRSPVRARATARSREESPAAAADVDGQSTLVAVPESESTVPMPTRASPVRGEQSVAVPAEEAAEEEEEPAAEPLRASARSPATGDVRARETTPPRAVTHQGFFRDVAVEPSNATEHGTRHADEMLEDGELTPPPRSPLFPPQVPPTLSVSSERLAESLTASPVAGGPPGPRSPPTTPEEAADARRSHCGDEVAAAAPHHDDTTISSIETGTSPSHTPLKDRHAAAAAAPVPPAAGASPGHAEEDGGDVCMDEGGRPSAAGSKELGGSSSWVVVSTARIPPRHATTTRVGNSPDAAEAVVEDQVTCDDDEVVDGDRDGAAGFRGFTPPPRPHQESDPGHRDDAQPRRTPSPPSHFLSDPMQDDLTDDDATPYR